MILVKHVTQLMLICTCRLHQLRNRNFSISLQQCNRLQHSAASNTASRYEWAFSCPIPCFGAQCCFVFAKKRTNSKSWWNSKCQDLAINFVGPNSIWRQCCRFYRHCCLCANWNKTWKNILNTLNRNSLTYFVAASGGNIAKLFCRKSDAQRQAEWLMNILFLFLFKWTISGLFCLFVFSIQLTVNVQYNFLSMTGFELRTSGLEATTLPTEPPPLPKHISYS